MLMSCGKGIMVNNMLKAPYQQKELNLKHLHRKPCNEALFEVNVKAIDSCIFIQKKSPSKECYY